MANVNNQVSNDFNATLSLNVKIPCSGHASLIVDELKGEPGVAAVYYQIPDIFKVNYDSRMTSPEKILAIEVFEIYRATIQ